MDQTELPLVSALAAAANRSDAAFHTPGHKRGQSAPSALLELFGKSTFRSDLPELPELDNLFAPEGAIAQAQLLAADAFGAEQTWFLANGSTCGIEAAVLATCNPDDKLILPRNMHQSAIAALILSGAVPIFVLPEYDAGWDIAHPPAAKEIAQALHDHPDAKAVLIVSPTYHGVCADVSAIAQLTHAAGLPLIVDEAHGAHFAFHPDLPTPALSAGVDLVVQSTHKTLSALTQAAMLHAQGKRIDRARLSASLRLVQSTSPNYLLLASLDAARQQMALEGKDLLDRTLRLSDRARHELSKIPGLRVLQANSLDRTRLTIGLMDFGRSGFEVDEELLAVGIAAELPALRHITFILSIGTIDADIDRLIAAFQQLDRRDRKSTPFPQIPNSQVGIANCLPPRSAFFCARTAVSFADAIDRLSAETVCPYPPGIPLLIPGEPITREAIDYLQQVIALGGIVTGCDRERLQVVSLS
ncbi:aminotransferase class I/II-fold pyridoxal phosphate-dependent enzyme [Microcoleus sp. FACHB-1515]|uniref:aminotransferase class I/II-fold pyridoxal phosphate-dependent enzyme n=1 Tax=Cyanophyceae TaxID=3028117 RepID=UPI00168744A8|nr:aminotransferase class I/II-fold pyridoxal phosphate-dependent enzyme [Microcoleus sp. FACHB-1515]MBD2088864.1 aminotransferase class I/II-fold pyridoxal phosphate-dependent enzyme [Microcoleus sp. FACHB-1515]